MRSFAAACIAFAGWAIIATIARRCMAEANGSVAHATLIYGAYLSHWSIAVTTVVFTALVVFPNASRAWWWVGQCLITNVAMTVGFWGAVPWKTFVVAPIDLQVLHALITPAVAVYWFVLTDKSHVRFNDTRYWLILPLLYTVWMEAYGFFSGYYPYVELNPFYQGRLNVLTSIGEIFLSTALVSWLLGLVNQRAA